MIAIIDYGMGNLRSVQKALESVGARACVTSSPQEIKNARAVVLPGVGAFRDCMTHLGELDLIPAVQQSIQSGKPFLGICLGLQVLFHQSEEFGPVEGLGILAGEVTRFPDGLNEGGNPLKIPHMGWNRVRQQKSMPLFDGVDDGAWFYFVHSYYVQPEDPNVVATTTSYGIDFVSGVHFDNVYALQFHPEKSQKCGLTVLRNFSLLK